MSKLDTTKARKLGTPAWPWCVNQMVEDSWEEAEYAWNHTVSIWVCVEGFGMPYFQVKGPDAVQLMSDTFINNFTRAKAGQIKEVFSCNDDGKILFDTMCLCKGDGVFELSGSVGILQYQMTKKHYDAQIVPVLPRTFIQVAGPKSFDVLQKLTEYDITQIKYAHFNPQAITFAGVENVRLVRITMTGELGFEIQAPVESYKILVEKLWETGAEYGLQQIGYKNHIVQHTESGQLSVQYGDGCQAIIDDEDYLAFLRANNDMFVSLGIPPRISGSYEPKAWSDFYLSPVELGFANRIDFSKEFKGKEALAEEVKNPKRKPVALEWNNEDILEVMKSWFADGEPHERIDKVHYDFMELPKEPRIPIEASKVLVNGKEVGFTTSRTYMYSFRKIVSHCMMPVEYAQEGREVIVIWGNPGHPQKNIRAKVTSIPYKPDATRSK